METNNKEALPVAGKNGTENAQTVSTSGEKRKNPENHLSPKPYEKSYPRVSKENLYMIIALWMEDFVDEAPKDHKKVGAVLVLPNDVVLAADCSRDGVHAVARLLMKHYDKAKGCKMFMSRKPCPICAKLLVQSKVERVLFLPFEPEYYRWPEPDADDKTRKDIKKYNQTNMKQVDMLFTASPIAQTKFVLQVEESVLKRAKVETPQQYEDDVKAEKERLIEKYSAFKEDSKWMKRIKKELPWPILDKTIANKVRDDFENVMEWIARVLVIPQSQSKPEKARGLNYKFQLCTLSKAPSDVFNPVIAKQTEEQVKQVVEQAKQAVEQANQAVEQDKQAVEQAKQAKKATEQAKQAKQAKHFITIARFLATRTDDPTTGVGAVIVSPKMQILALGWNGFPLKAQYGEFGRGSGKDTSVHDKKFPYVIHAEQNALLMRNNKNIEDSILFVTRPPCNECAPLIAMEGVKIVVVDSDVKPEEEQIVVVDSDVKPEEEQIVVVDSDVKPEEEQIVDSDVDTEKSEEKPEEKPEKESEDESEGESEGESEEEPEEESKKEPEEEPEWNKLQYDRFPEMVEDGQFVCYHTKKKPLPGDHSPTEEVIVDLEYEEEAANKRHESMLAKHLSKCK
jgi:dCMP deaminase